MAQCIKVGIADMNVVSGDDTITTIGLGSCIGIAIRDTVKKIGGLVHIMLPDSTAVRSNATIAKFADTGIPELVRLLEAKGCVKRNMEAKIAGGAQMFAFQNKQDMLAVGQRNAEATRKALKELGIPIKAEDCGSTYGRTVVYYPATGAYEIRAVGQPPKTI